MNYPDLVIEVSWEVCNKVGGIYTVLSTHAATLQSDKSSKLVFIGPDIWKGKTNDTFVEEPSLHQDWQQAAAAMQLPIRVGHWNVPSHPMVMLVDFSQLYAQKMSFMLGHGSTIKWIRCMRMAIMMRLRCFLLLQASWWLAFSGRIC